MLYATGTLRSVTPDSRVKEGTIAICWSGMREAKGFSDCAEALSTGFSICARKQGSMMVVLTEFMGHRGLNDSFSLSCHCTELKIVFMKMRNLTLRPEGVSSVKLEWMSQSTFFFCKCRDPAKK